MERFGTFQIGLEISVSVQYSRVSVAHSHSPGEG